ncbi:MAG: DUF2917 domain-containing protein [Caldimonas sp.]
MVAQLMQKLQRSSDSVWSLPNRASTTLRIGPGARVLQVCAGRLWLTASGNADCASLDLWLEPGDGVALAAGLEVVIEAWPSARFQLLVPPTVCRPARQPAARLVRAVEWFADKISTRPRRYA